MAAAPSKVQRVVAYSLLGGEAVVLVWRTSRSSLHASLSRFDAVHAEERREDRGCADRAAARVLATETRGALVSEEKARRRLKANRGVLRHLDLVVVPTPFASAAALAEGGRGEGRWVLAAELAAAARAGRGEVRAAPGVEGQAREERVPLALSFVAALGGCADALVRTVQAAGGRVGDASAEEEKVRAEEEASAREAREATDARRAAVPDVSEVYACGRCRRLLFGAAAVDAHEPAGGRAEKCTSLFLRDSDAVYAALGGRAEVFGETQGKVSCPKCAAPLGRYNWSGGTCACGAWITPAVQVVKSRVDLRRVRVKPQI